MKHYDLDKYNSLDEIWADHNDMHGRKIMFLRHMPIGGTFREIGVHQGLGALQALIGKQASYVDLYDIKDQGFSKMKKFLTDFNYDYTLTDGSPIPPTTKEVDVTFIDAEKTGTFVYEALVANAPLTKIAIGVDDTISDCDIINGVNKFLEEDNEWVLDSVLYTYPGLAVLKRRSTYNIVPGQGN